MNQETQTFRLLDTSIFFLVMFTKRLVQGLVFLKVHLARLVRLIVRARIVSIFLLYIYKPFRHPSVIFNHIQQDSASIGIFVITIVGLSTLQWIILSFGIAKDVVSVSSPGKTITPSLLYQLFFDYYPFRLLICFMILTWYAILGAVFGIRESIGVYFIRTVSVRDFVYYRMVQSMVLGGLTILVGQIVFGGMMLLPRILLKLTSEELIGDLTFIDDLMMAATDMFVLFGGAMVALEIVLFLPLMVAELVMEIVIGGTLTESTLLWVIGAWIGVLLIVFWVLPGWIVLYDNTKSWWKPALMLVGYALYAGPVLLLFGFIASPGDFIGSRVMPPGNTSSVPVPQSARENIYFEFGVATLTDEAEAALNDILDDIENREIDAVIITGYADTAEEAAGELSERRADTVATELVKTGIARELIRTEGVGSSDLAVPTPRGTREAANRRVTIEFVR